MLIGELAASAGLSAKAIRFYEEAGLMPAPPRTPGGYRDYPPGAAGRLAFIRQAQAAGFSLAEIRGILRVRDGGHAPRWHGTRPIREDPAQGAERSAEPTRTRP